MNERIELLAGQAKFMAEEDINKQISYNAELKAFAEKFAELIVRECASKAWFVEQYGIGDGTPVSKQIKEHFGVE
jgi:hypothetical protein